MYGSAGMRRKSKKASSPAFHAQEPNMKFIAGVPVMNYHLAYKGSSLSEMQRDNVREKWVIVLKPDASDSDINVLCEKGNRCNFFGHPSSGGVPFIEVQGSEQDLQEMLEHHGEPSAAAGMVEFIEPDLPVRAIPEIHGEPSAAAASWGLERVGVAQRNGEGNGAHVYVMDTGIRTTHSDFGGRAIATLDMTSGSTTECNGAASCAADRDGHGTHCSGTVGGRTYGVAPGATLHAVKVLSDQGDGDWSWIYASLDWIATQGARPAAASMSLGGGGPLSAVEVAIDAAVSAGVTVVVAAGNENDDACNYSPSFVPSAITVGSTDSRDQRSYFSSYGSCTNIWAPGSAITSADAWGDNDEAVMSGTSMSCPHVSGAVALLLESNPTWTPGQVLQSMLATAEADAISGLFSDDTNRLLFVGGGGSPSPQPTPTEAPTKQNK